jgi:hypothetical protein
VKGTRAKLAGTGHLRSQDRRAAVVSIVEDFDDFGLVVAPTEICFVDDECATEGIENMKNRRDGRGARCEHWLVAKRADHKQKAGFAAAVVAPHTEVREFVEAVVEPGEENVVAGDPLELRGEIDVAVDVGLDLRRELGLRAILLWTGRQQDYVVFDEVILRRIRYEPLARGKFEGGHD